MKGICLEWSRGRHFSPSLPGDRYLKLGSKSDLRAEISGSIVWYNALAPRPEVLRFWYLVRACAILLKSNFLPYAWEKYPHRATKCTEPLSGIKQVDVGQIWPVITIASSSSLRKLPHYIWMCSACALQKHLSYISVFDLTGSTFPPHLWKNITYGIPAQNGQLKAILVKMLR